MYTAFASVYDRLMADVDYLAWARFYHELMELKTWLEIKMVMP